MIHTIEYKNHKTYRQKQLCILLFLFTTKKKPESTRKQKYKTSGATKFKMIKRSNSDTNQEK